MCMCKYINSHTASCWWSEGSLILQLFIYVTEPKFYFNDYLTRVYKTTVHFTLWVKRTVLSFFSSPNHCVLQADGMGEWGA